MAGYAGQPRALPYGMYWVRPDRLLAGPYPGGWMTSETERRLNALLAAGITLFVDLTEPGEVDSYLTPLMAQAAPWGCSVQHERLAIPDMGVPSDEHMRRILDTIDDGLARDERVYVHCLGGIGRTGTVVGCWLVRHGLDGEAALAAIVQKRGGLSTSPETDAQRRMVRTWQESADR